MNIKEEKNKFSEVAEELEKTCSEKKYIKNKADSLSKEVEKLLSKEMRQKSAAKKLHLKYEVLEMQLQEACAPSQQRTMLEQVCVCLYFFDVTHTQCS